MGRFASIDYGLARIGLAISDERKIIASALKTVMASKKASGSASVAAALAPYEIEAIIVGLPIHFNGKKGFLADEVLAFIDSLKGHVSCPVITWEERLSTVQAEKALREGNLSRKKRSAVIDSVTAVILLQNYLEFLRLKTETY